MIRTIGTCIILGILGFLIRTIAAFATLLPFVTVEIDSLTYIMILVLLPIILRIAVLGGGFIVPPTKWRNNVVGQGAAPDP